jgi:hypothetical protein
LGILLGIPLDFANMAPPRPKLLNHINVPMAALKVIFETTTGIHLIEFQARWA